MHPYRSHTCGQLRLSDAGSNVRLSGWVHNRRDLGGLLFIDLRDHYGVTQLLIPKDAPFLDAISRLPKETVIRVDGKVVTREGNVNRKMPTGEIELIVSAYEVLGPMHGSDEFDGQLPFSVFPEDEAPEDARLKYRFLDLRRSKLHANIVLRSRVISSIRRRMTDMGFQEYSTPILTSSSPEGARDYLVPSRVHAGKFYALPQAPQQFKQLLMVAGFDRYFQIAPCFRDEDARADRSPGEFYQLDLEMSFATQDDVFAAMETLFTGLFPEFRPDFKMTPAPFPRIPYAEAMLKYGSDKPDLRVPLEIRDATEVLGHGQVPFMQGKTVRVLPLPGCGDKSRKFFDTLDARARADGLGGLAWVKVKADGGFEGGFAKFITPEVGRALLQLSHAGPGFALLAAADTDVAKLAKVLGGIRRDLGYELGLAEKDVFKFCWIVDFPMFELDEEGKVAFSHNPFSMPQGGLEALDSQDPLTIKAFQYDIVCNGVELSSGAIRNHRPDVMYRAFEIAGYTRDDVDKRFGGMINAFKLGAPPHGGIAPGVDRIVMLLAEEKNIREVIAFPMNQRAQDLMMGAPSEVTERQLRELHIKIDAPKQ